MKKNTVYITTLLAVFLGATQGHGAFPALQNYVASVKQTIADAGGIVQNNLRTVPEEVREIGRNYEIAWANRPPLHEIVAGALTNSFIRYTLPTSIPSLPQPLAVAHDEMLTAMNRFDNSQFLPITCKIAARRGIFTVLAGCAVADCVSRTATFVNQDLLSIPTIVGIYAGSIAGSVYLANKLQPFFKQPLQNYQLALSAAPTEIVDAHELEPTLLPEDDCYICAERLLEDVAKPLMQLPICECTKPRYLHRECYLHLLRSTQQLKPCAHCNKDCYHPQQKVALRLRGGNVITNY